MLSFLTLGTGKAQAIIIDWRLSATLWPDARFTFANIGETRGIVINWRFIDADGEIVATRSATHYPFDKMVSLDFARNTLPA